MSQKSPHSDRSTVMQLSLAVMAIAALASSFTAHAQGLSDAEISRLKNYLFDELTKQNFVKLNRVTKQGELSSCETEFQYVYRDVRARQGSPVVLTGSFSSTWTPGKLPSFMYKINAAEMNIKDTKWTVSAPPFINITVGKKSFKPYQSIDFVCESGGRCVGYTDPKFDINLAVVEALPFDATISWSLSKDGLDNSVSLSEIGSRQQTRKALDNFYECNMEINNMLGEYLKSKSK